MAYSGGGGLVDVEIDQQDDQELVIYLVTDDETSAQALCQGYPANYETCNPSNPMQLIGAQISFSGVTDETVPNPWNPEEQLPYVIDAEVTQCPS